MRKMLVLGIVVLVISLGFTACKDGGGIFGQKGGTLKLINDTASDKSFYIYFNSALVRVNDGVSNILPNQTIKAVSDVDTTYNVYRYYGDSTPLWSGSLSGGDTIELRFSTWY